jgi:hypothetical protein
MLMVSVEFWLKADRLEAYPTCLTSVYSECSVVLIYESKVPAARRLLLARQLTTDRSAELPAGHRG